MRCAGDEPADPPCRGERERPRPRMKKAAPSPPAVGRPATRRPSRAPCPRPARCGAAALAGGVARRRLGR